MQHCVVKSAATYTNLKIFEITPVAGSVGDFRIYGCQIRARALRHARCERRLWAQQSQCDTVEQPIAIHMAGICESFRNHFYNASSRFRRIEGIPHKEPPLFAEPVHVDQRASLCFGGCPRLSHSLADRRPHLFDTSPLDLALFETMKTRPFEEENE